jgi:hypothetical protein
MTALVNGVSEIKPAKKRLEISRLLAGPPVPTNPTGVAMNKSLLPGVALALMKTPTAVEGLNETVRLSPGKKNPPLGLPGRLAARD